MDEAAKQTVLRWFPYGLYAVTVMCEGEDQRDLAARLGRPAARLPHKLVDVPSRPGTATGSPILDHSLGWLECRVVSTMPAGDHTLVVGEVLEAGVARQGRALTLDETGIKYAG